MCSRRLNLDNRIRAGGGRGPSSVRARPAVRASRRACACLLAERGMSVSAMSARDTLLSSGRTCYNRGWAAGLFHEVGFCGSTTGGDVVEERRQKPTRSCARAARMRVTATSAQAQSGGL